MRLNVRVIPNAKQNKIVEVRKVEIRFWKFRNKKVDFGSLDKLGTSASMLSEVEALSTNKAFREELGGSL